MTLDNSGQDISFNAARGGKASSSSSLGSSTHSRLDPLHSVPAPSDVAPTIPSPLSQSTTAHEDADLPREEWSAEAGRYGLSAATVEHHQSQLEKQRARIFADSRPSPSTSNSFDPTLLPSIGAPTSSSQAGASSKTAGKRPAADRSAASSHAFAQPPSKKARKQHSSGPAPPKIDLTEFQKPALPLPQIDGLTSPLFFSNRRRPRMTRPLSYTGSEATVGTMLRSVRESAEVTTLKLARGTVSSQSPARSSSTPGSWSSIDAAGTNRSPDVHSSSPLLQALHGIGILELLHQDDRPTFVVDGVNGISITSGAPLSILHWNPALEVSVAIRQLVTGDFQDNETSARTEFDNFKLWIKNAGSADGEVFLGSHHYAGLEWTCSVLKHRFRFVSANRSAASIARTSPEPLLERDVSIEARGNTPNAQPRTPSDIAIPDAPDYFGNVTGLDIEESRARSFAGSDAGDTLLEGVDINSEFLPISSIPQQSFDWTRIPLTDDLPEHIKFARTRDWASTSLGPVESWTPGLRAMANLVMGSPHPAALYWGPDYVTIYNEAYIPMAGQKHPMLMGQSYAEAWKEIWSDLSPILQAAWDSGQATMKNDDRLIINRLGFDEETFFSWSIVPLVGDDGSVVGLFNPAFEHTRRKLAERRMLTLREVGEKTALARDVKSFWSQVHKGLEFNVEDVPFVLVYSVADDSSESDISSMHSANLAHPPSLILEASLGVPQNHPCLISPLDLRTSLEGFAPYMRDSMAQQGAPIILSKEDGSLADDVMNGFEFRGGSECRSIVIFPVHPTTGGDGVVGFIVMGVNPQRPYDEDYRLFIQLLSRQLATSMASVVLFEEEIRRGQRAARLAALDRQELTQQLHLRTQEVEESELKFTRMAEFAPVGMFIADSRGSINYCNDMWWQISRHPRSEDNINSWMDSVKDEDKPALRLVWQNLINQKATITHEFRFKASSRGEKNSAIDNWVLMSAYPETNMAGSIIGIFGCITDISQQKLAEQIHRERREEAVELKRQQENFIDITSHEMRNPLSAILQCADEIAGILAKYKKSDDFNKEAEELRLALEGCIEAANTITLCASHQKRIVDDILTLSKLDSQLLLVTPVDVQPLAVVQRVLKMFEGELNTNDIQLQLKVKNRYIDLGVDWVKLDPSRLLQVLINLITNAIKFTNSRPKRSIVVTVDASRDVSERTDSNITYFQSDRENSTELTDSPDWGEGEKINLHFSVEDTGRGLDEHETKLLFQRFSQTTPRTHVQYGGSGLGLFISRILTELQGGQIGVYSEKGVGSTFSFYVRSRKTTAPAASEAMATAPPLQRAPGSSTTIENRQPKSGRDSQDGLQKRLAQNKPKAPPGQGPFDVLIVEDNLVNQKVLQRQLRNVGNNTQVANHGGEAIDVLKRSRFWLGQEDSGSDISVILMDLEMPVMDGMTCARKIRELERDGTIVSHIPIIAVTAYARPEQIEDAKAAGIDDVISKPFRIPELMPKISELVDRYPQSQSIPVA